MTKGRHTIRTAKEDHPTTLHIVRLLASIRLFLELDGWGSPLYVIVEIDSALMVILSIPVFAEWNEHIEGAQNWSTCVVSASKAGATLPKRNLKKIPINSM